jgi:hypothetical protein
MSASGVDGTGSSDHSHEGDGFEDGGSEDRSCDEGGEDEVSGDADDYLDWDSDRSGWDSGLEGSGSLSASGVSLEGFSTISDAAM